MSLSFVVNGKVYQVKSLLGQGGFSTVYETTDGYALKCIAATKKDYTQEEIYRFYLIEKLALLALRSKYVVQIFNSGRNETHYFLVLEKFGKSLDDYLESKGFLEEQIVALFKKCLESLRHIHRQGYVHRDINLLNILLENGEVRITDFGFCQPIYEIQSRLEWDQEFLHGMIGYVAPEVLEVPEYDHFKRDIFGLGRSFYRILTLGSIPFQLDQPIPPLEHVACMGNPKIFQIVNKMIALNPINRYGMVDEILVDCN
ncbi:MAG: serine/threonine-protein kinase [Planctomycetota bacterium]